MNITRKGALSLGFLTSLSFTSCTSKKQSWNQEPTSTKGLWGYIDTSGSWVIPPRFDEADDFGKDGIAAVRFFDTEKTTKELPRVRWSALIDSSGSFVVQPTSWTDFMTKNEYPIFRKDQYSSYKDDYKISDWNFSGIKCGVTDSSGKWITQNYVHDFTLNAGIGSDACFAATDVNRAWGISDKYGNWVFKPSFERINFDTLYSPDWGYLLSVKDKTSKKWGWAHKSGEWTIDPAFKSIGNFYYANLASACDYETGNWGLVNKDGEWTITPSFSYLSSPNIESCCIAQDLNSSLYGLLGVDGNWLSKPSYMDIKTSPKKSSSCFAVQERTTSLWKMIDLGQEASQMSSEFKALELYDKNQCIACDTKTNLWGFIDFNGNWIIEPRFQTLGCFSSDGLAAAQSAE